MIQSRRNPGTLVIAIMVVTNTYQDWLVSQKQHIYIWYGRDNCFINCFFQDWLESQI